MDTRDAKFIEARIQGNNKRQSAKIATGTTSDKTADVQANRILKKPQVQSELARILKRQGITLSKAIKPISEALQANKLMVHGKGTDDSWVDVVPDHAVRLAGSDRALKLIRMSKEFTQPTQPLNDTLRQALEDNPDLDEIELQRMVFKTNQNAPETIEE